jgi:hypothetical protein
LLQLASFWQGLIPTLYAQASSIAPTPNDAPVRFAGDDDPCPWPMRTTSAAYQHIQSSLPIAKVTPEVKARVSTSTPQESMSPPTSDQIKPSTRASP